MHSAAWTCSAGALVWHGSEMRRFRRLLSPPLQHLLTRSSSSTLGRGAASMTSKMAKSMGSCQALMHLATDAVQAAVESPFLENVRAQAGGALCCVSLPPGAPQANAGSRLALFLHRIDYVLSKYCTKPISLLEAATWGRCVYPQFLQLVQAFAALPNAEAWVMCCVKSIGLLWTCLDAGLHEIDGQASRGIAHATARLAVQAAAGAVMQMSNCTEIVMWYTTLEVKTVIPTLSQ